VAPAPSTRYVNPPSYRPSYTAPLHSYYQEHYYNGTFPHYDHYSYYDIPPSAMYSRKPSWGTAADLGGGTSSLGPLYPDEYSYAPSVPPPGVGRDEGDAIAFITVKVPPDAEVRFDGYKTTTTGPVRRFETPLLKPRQPYTYTVEARWKENGREVTQKQDVPVAAGANVRLDFPLPSGGKDKAGEAKQK
jgi:uncharacterized protein (TIGR03000 family)